MTMTDLSFGVCEGLLEGGLLVVDAVPCMVLFRSANMAGVGMSDLAHALRVGSTIQRQKDAELSHNNDKGQLRR